MSCCNVKKETSSNKYLEILENNFDEVSIEKREMYQLLTLKDKARKPGYDWIIWLQLKIAYGHTNSCSHNSEKKLEGAMEGICNWLELLKDFDRKSKPKQLSLFGDENELELEKEPESPQGGADNQWAKYFRECERVRKSNLMKQYSFFELFEDTGAWWQYNDIDYSRLLPQSNEEMIEFVKEYLSGNIQSSILQGNEFEDEYSYLTRDDALSDIELYHRVLFKFDFGLIPYESKPRLMIDNGFTAHETIGGTRHRVQMRRGKLEGSSWDNREYPSYDFKIPDFLNWVRWYFKIPYREPVSDEYVLKENIEHFIDSMLWYGREKYDWKEKINTFETWKQFKSDIHSFMQKEGIDSRNGGGSGFSLDGLDGGYDLFKKGNITIKQNLQERLEMHRSIDGLEVEERHGDKEVIVFNISGDEIYQKTFDFFNQKQKANQISLFDFVA